MVIYRKPISPYITEKVTSFLKKYDENFVFQLNKSTSKNKILRFLKIYDEITKCIDEEVTVLLHSETYPKYC